MRMNIFYSLLLVTLLSIVSIGCSDNNVEWESDEIPSDKITLDVQGILDLLHNETAIVKILTGNGSYQVDSQDKDVAKAEVVSTNEIKISAVSGLRFLLWQISSDCPGSIVFPELRIVSCQR